MAVVPFAQSTNFHIPWGGILPRGAMIISFLVTLGVILGVGTVRSLCHLYLNLLFLCMLSLFVMFVNVTMTNLSPGILLFWQVYLLLTGQTTIEFHYNQMQKWRAKRHGEVFYLSLLTHTVTFYLLISRTQQFNMRQCQRCFPLTSFLYGRCSLILIIWVLVAIFNCFLVPTIRVGGLVGSFPEERRSRGTVFAFPPCMICAKTNLVTLFDFLPISE